MGEGRRGRILPPSTVRGLESQQLFDKVAEEVLHQDRALFDGLSAHEREIVIRWLSDAIVNDEGSSALHDVLWEIDYYRKPVGPEEFFDNEYYFGRSCSALHPAWKEDLYHVFGAGSPVFEWVMTGAIGIGKALSVGSQVLTPHGWVLAGEVRVGDLLIGRGGKATRCSGVFPQGVRELFRVTFSDGASVLVDGDHIWSVRTASAAHRDQQYVTKTTKELVGDTRVGSSRKWHIPVVDPVEYAPTHIPLPAYSVGALIGDGCLVSGGIRLSSIDPEIVEEVACELGLVAKHTGWGCDYRLVRDRGDCAGHPLAVLRGLGLCVGSPEKRIPAAYLTASVRDRKRLLAGLLDTDGWVQNGGSTTAFSTSSLGLAEDVIALVRSLGGIARRTLKTTTHLDAHVLTLRLPECPFELSRKQTAWSPSKAHGLPVRMVDAVEVAHKAEAVCFSVEASDALFVVDDFIVTHNTTLACAGLGYKLYQLSCLRDPSAYYGLLPDSLVVFGVYSITKRQVADAGYYKLRGFIDSSPYFRQEFPRSKKIDSKIDFERSVGRKVQVIPGSQELHALGLDLFSFLMDEVNFMRVKNNKEAGIQTGQAYDLYNATYTRLQSRFIRPGGTLPGMMFLLSSRNSQTSFLEEHLRKVRGQASTHISDYALWDVKSKKKFTLPTFPVEIGDRVAGSRLLKPGEEVRAGARVVDIPGEFRKPFLEDIDQALRDLAGIATFNLAPLVRDRQSVFDGVQKDMEHPFTMDTLVIDLHDDIRLDDYFKLRTVARTDHSEWRPILNPSYPRFVHVDIGLTGDALGFAMGHVAGKIKNTRWNPDGTESSISNPYAVIDMMCRVVPPPGGEVDLSKIRSFLIYLSKIYSISLVTFDGFQSADSIQILKKSGIAARKLSVDRDDEAYLSLRSAMFDRRIAYYQYQPFIDEVLDLERDTKTRKVDHPTRATRGGKGSKDVADGVAGVVWHLMNDPNATAVLALPDFEAAAIGTEEGVRDPSRNGHKNPLKRVVHKPSLSPARDSASDRKVGSARWESLRGNVHR